MKLHCKKVGNFTKCIFKSEQTFYRNDENFFVRTTRTEFQLFVNKKPRYEFCCAAPRPCTTAFCVRRCSSRYGRALRQRCKLNTTSRCLSIRGIQLPRDSRRNISERPIRALGLSTRNAPLLPTFISMPYTRTLVRYLRRCLQRTAERER